MKSLGDLTILSKDLQTEAQVIDFGVLILAAVAEHLSRQDDNTKRKPKALQRAAGVLSEFKTSLQFAPNPLLDQTTN